MYIQKQEIRSVYESFCEHEGMVIDKEDSDQDEDDTYFNPELEELEEVMPTTYTLDGQENHQQQVPYPELGNRLENHQQEVKEMGR